MQKFTLPDKNCPKCERLCAFHEQNRQQYPDFYNGAVPSFGGLEAEFLIVGLAPGLKGANATGIPFTGDYAGDVLYPALAKNGFMGDDPEWVDRRLPSDVFRSTYQQSSTINHQLYNARITNAVRCVPPENKPTTAEINECNPFLTNEIAGMPNLKVILTLGLVSHKAVLKALGYKQSAFKFEHGSVHSINMEKGSQQVEQAQLKLLNSYHTSRYNVNTGRLTFEMFDEIISQASRML